MSTRKLLEALGSGQPVGGEEASNLFNPTYSLTIAPILREIDDAIGHGLSKKRKVFWVKGRPGNGKTQTLRRLTHKLQNLTGTSKFAYVFIDLDKNPAARKGETLVPTIVRTTLSSSIIEDVKTVRTRIIEGNPTPESAEETLAFSIDLIADLAGIPAFSLFLGFGIKRILSWFRTREGFIKNILAQTWGSNPELLELLTIWLRYIIQPDRERDEEFNTLLRRLASQGDLFGLYAFVLEKAKYPTLILILDELDLVTIDSLKPLWDPPDPTSDKLQHEINIIMILSAQEDVVESVRKDEALERRFLRTESGKVELNGPKVNKDGRDDLDHVLGVVTKLLAESPELAKTGVNVEEVEKKLREMFLNTEPTWQTLWQEVIKELADL